MIFLSISTPVIIILGHFIDKKWTIQHSSLIILEFLLSGGHYLASILVTYSTLMFISNSVIFYSTISRVPYTYYLQVPIFHSLPTLLLTPVIPLKQLLTKINSNFLIDKSSRCFSSPYPTENYFPVFNIINHSFPTWDSGFPCIQNMYPSGFYSSWKVCLWFFMALLPLTYWKLLELFTVSHPP